MIRVTGTVVYQSGEQAAFRGGPVEWMAWEQYALTRGLPTAAQDPTRAAGLTMSWYLAYRSATKGLPPATRPGFEKWLETVDEINGLEISDAPPTPPARSVELSASSPSQPASVPASSGV